MLRAEEELLDPPGSEITVFLTVPSNQTLYPRHNPVLFLTFLLWSSLIWAVCSALDWTDDPRGHENVMHGTLCAAYAWCRSLWRFVHWRSLKCNVLRISRVWDVQMTCAAVVSLLGLSVWWWLELQTHDQLFFIWSIHSPRTWVWWCAVMCASWVPSVTSDTCQWERVCVCVCLRSE